MCLPHLVEERTFSIGIVLDALAVNTFAVSEIIEGKTQYFGMCVHV